MIQGPSPVSIGQFVTDLGKLRFDELTLPRVHSYMEHHPVDLATLRPYLVFSSSQYTRNLIYKCDDFEILTLCWDTGQQSSVHDHDDQQCWMSVLMGTLTVKNYRVLSRTAGGSSRVECIGEEMFSSWMPAAVDPDVPVHAILNDPARAQKAASLHVYSRPLVQCRTYDLATNTCKMTRLSYTNSAAGSGSK